MSKYATKEDALRALATTIEIDGKTYSLRRARILVERSFYKYNNNIELTKNDLQHDVAVKVFLEQNKRDSLAWAKANDINISLRNKKSRVKKRITLMWMLFLGGGYLMQFLTLTFNDDVLNNTNEDTRKQYVRRYLNDVSVDYVANIDYGSKNDREHYHAVVLANKRIDYKKWHKYGAIKARIVRDDSTTTDVARMSSYVNKLSNHSLKDSNMSQTLLYGRKAKKNGII